MQMCWDTFLKVWGGGVYINFYAINYASVVGVYSVMITPISIASVFVVWLNKQMIKIITLK